MPSKFRIKLLKALAQSNIPTTDKAANIVPNLGTPPNFNPTNKDSILKAFNTPGAYRVIEQMANELNKAMFYASTGQYNLQNAFQTGFTYTDATFSPASKDLKAIVLFAKEFYIKIYNSGINYTSALTKKEYLDKINYLLNIQNLEKLSQVNPSSQLATKIGVNIKEKFKNFLTTLITLAPTK
jgi:hypothetical protein